MDNGGTRSGYYKWTPEEDITILSNGFSLKELSKKLGRTVGSIQTRRHKLRTR